jgi:hypothetical protein
MSVTIRLADCWDSFAWPDFNGRFNSGKSGAKKRALQKA